MQVPLLHLTQSQKATIQSVQSAICDTMEHKLPHVLRQFSPNTCHLLWNAPSVHVPEQCPHTDAPPDCTDRCVAHQGYSVLVALQSCRLVVWRGVIVSRTAERTRVASSTTLCLERGSWVIFRDDLLHAGAAYVRGDIACRLHFASARKPCTSCAGTAASIDDGFTVWTAAGLRRIGVR